MNLLEDQDIDCPYCGESQNVSVDCSTGSYDFIEDCTVCCRPIELHADINDGVLSGLNARRDDD